MAKDIWIVCDELIDNLIKLLRRCDNVIDFLKFQTIINYVPQLGTWGAQANRLAMDLSQKKIMSDVDEVVTLINLAIHLIDEITYYSQQYWVDALGKNIGNAMKREVQTIHNQYFEFIYYKIQPLIEKYNKK